MKTLSLALLFFCAASAFAKAGIFVGNGGHVVECVDAAGQISSRDTFDLYEGRALFHYNYMNVRDAEGIARALAQKIDAGLDQSSKKVMSIEERVNYIINKKTLLPPGVGLDNTGDTHEFIKLPPNCQMRQTVNFRNSNLIYINSDVWNALSPLNQAALYLHEALYWYLREPGVENDSRRARAAVAYAFSGGEFTPPSQLPAGIHNFQYCHSSQRDAMGDWSGKLIAYRGTDGQPVVQLLNLGGHHFLSRTTWSGQVDGGVSEMPLQSKSSNPVKIVSQLQSPLDHDAIIQMVWGRGQIAASGLVQPQDAVRDLLQCEEVHQ